jgi:1,2-diacylglycerol 3-beta-glucosyltransferase
VRAALQLAPVAAGAYLLVLLAASRRPADAVPPGERRHRFAVVVPAHDEEASLPATLASIAALDYPRERFEAVVVADNCTDATARVAAAAGATVLERHEPERRGKGQALAWGLERLPGAPDAVVIVDADCTVSANLLSAFDRELAAGAAALQAANEAANPEASPRAALRAAAFLLYNRVRPLGRQRLGLSVGLLGTGMCFSRELLERCPWRAFSHAEDREFHLMLAMRGERVRFVPNASVRSSMPTTGAQAATQQARWDSGRLRLAARYAPALLTRGLRRREPAAVDAALEPLLPPQALLAAMNLASALAALASRRRDAVALAVAGVAGQSLFVLGGLWSVGAPPAAWRGLLGAPGFVAGRVWGLARMALGRGPLEWVRTAR